MTDPTPAPMPAAPGTKGGATLIFCQPARHDGEPGGCSLFIRTGSIEMVWGHGVGISPQAKFELADHEARAAALILGGALSEDG